MKKLNVLAFAAALLLPVAGLAQSDEKNEFSVWGGFAPAVRVFEPTGGRSWDSTFGIAALRYARRFNNSDWVNLKYTVDAVPLAILRYPDRVNTPTLVGPGGPVLAPVVRTRETRYAFGVSPVGLQANFRPRKKLQPFIGLSLGLLVFNKTTPNDFGTKLNFSTEGGAGVEYRLANKKGITVGYKFYHISNASRGVVNPGYDVQLLYLGYTFSFK